MKKILKRIFMGLGGLIAVLVLGTFLYFRYGGEEAWPENVIQAARSDCFALAQNTGKLFPSESGPTRNFQDYNELQKLMTACDCLVNGMNADGAVEIRGSSDILLPGFWEKYRSTVDAYLKKDPPILSDCKAVAGLSS